MEIQKIMPLEILQCFRFSFQKNKLCLRLNQTKIKPLGVNQQKGKKRTSAAQVVTLQRTSQIKITLRKFQETKITLPSTQEHSRQNNQRDKLMDKSQEASITALSMTSKERILPQGKIFKHQIHIRSRRDSSLLSHKRFFK